MIELKKYQCEHCQAIYDREEFARTCEGKHIEHPVLQIVRAIHERCSPVEFEEGKWPAFIIVGKDEVRNKFMRYKLESEENAGADYFTTDGYYNPENK